MAEAILQNAAGDLIQVCSAGSKPSAKVHPKAITALAEIGLDISAHNTKHADSFCACKIHTVITVCGNADQVCPTYPGMEERFHWGFDDPDKATGTDEEVMRVFRSVRNQIRMVFEAYAAGLRAGRKLPECCSAS